MLLRQHTLLIIVFTCLVSSGIAQNWQRGEGLPSGVYYAIAEHNGILYTGSDSTLFKSTDSGMSWKPLAGLLPAGAYFSRFFSHNGYLYVATTNAGVLRSSNDGNSWQDFSAGLGGWARYIVDLCVIGDTLYAGTGGDGVYYMNLLNPGQWKSYNEGLSQLGVSTLSVSGRTLVASIGMYVFIRPQNTSAWIEVQIDATQEQRPALKFISAGDYIFAGTSTGLYRGSADGMSWSFKDIKLLSKLPIGSFAAHESRLFAGVTYKLDHFICSSDDSGETWTVRAHEFAQLLDMTVYNNMLFTVRTDGVWYMPLSAWTGIGETGNSDKKNFRLHQNYPNPFNPVTNIRYQIPADGNVMLKVFDIAGNEVAVLVNGMQTSGSHEVLFNAAGLSTGIYFYELRTGSLREVKKLILLK